MAGLSNSLVLPHNPPPVQLFPGSCMLADQRCAVSRLTTFSFAPSAARRTGKRSLVQAVSGDGGRSSSAAAFVGGFMLGGLAIGALGVVYAPQISKALAGADRKDLMRKLPKFIYDEGKALEKTRKVLTEKIAQLNSAIDDVSAQLRAQDTPNGAAVTSDELETAV